MCQTLILTPETLRVGTPITAQVHVEHIEASLLPALEITPFDPGLDSISIPAHVKSGMVEAQFSLSLPGKYHLKLGQYQRDISILPATTLDFSTEFGFFSIGVILLLAGMIKWLWKQKKII